jgi:hypothetical protein
MRLQKQPEVCVFMGEMALTGKGRLSKGAEEGGLTIATSLQLRPAA